MAKGISEIISGILIVLVVVTLAGAFLIWSSSAFTGLSQTGTRGQQQFEASTEKAISIDALQCGATDSLTIRNSGAVVLSTSDITVYKNEVPMSGITWNTGSVNANGVATTLTNFNANATDEIRVAVAGGVRGDAQRCPP